MKKKLRNQFGFSLVELMITIIIIGILAAAAIPIYKGQVNRAKAAEADAALGTIRTSLRIYYAEHNTYPTAADSAAVTSLSIGIGASDLDGTYFSTTDFTYHSNDGVSYEIYATGSGEQAGINRKLNNSGTLSDF